MDEVAELSAGAADRTVEVAARYCAVVARFYNETLSRSDLLLLCDNCADSSLRLLLLGPQLDGLHGRNSLLLFHLVFGLNLVDRVLDHKQQLLVRHAWVVAEQVHDFLALAYKEKVSNLINNRHRSSRDACSSESS